MRESFIMKMSCSFIKFPKLSQTKKARISPGPLAIANLQGIILKNIC